jgi:hypothetical protein
MSCTKETLHEAVNSLTDEQAQEALEFVQILRSRADMARLHRVLGHNPAIRVPTKPFSGYRRVEPVKGTGIPASELLIRERQ